MRYLILLLLAPFTLIAQPDQAGEEDVLIKCHTDEMQEALFQSNPALRVEAEEYKKQLESFTESFSQSIEKRSSDDPYIIPVVFHIIHNYGTENISDAQVEDCIRVMNEDFSAQNTGANFVNPAFQDLVANVGIEFRLAQLDEDGNCTNGIIRTANELTDAGGENLKSISPIWDRSKYMNVWVCREIESGAAGYTYYPSTLAGAFGLTNDGIVVRSNYVGAIGTSNDSRSHTLTHEVGHWINLAHLWGSTNEPGVTSNCNSDDGVSDTPNTIGWTSCSTNGESCGSLDNVENFMEYAYCSKMFTNGQSNRMIAALNSNVASRSSLWQEQNLIDTGVLDEQVLCKVDFTSNKTHACAGQTIDFTNQSFSAIETHSWTFEGGTPATSDEVNPSVVYDQPGTYTVSLTVSDGNDALTEVKTEFISVFESTEMDLPFTEGFENATTLDPDNNSLWVSQSVIGDMNWEVTSAASYSGQHSALVNGFGNPIGESSYLLSLPFDFSEVEGNARLTFKYASARRNPTSDDELKVWLSFNCGQNWLLRKTIQADELYTVNGYFSAPFFPESTADWNEAEISSVSNSFLSENLLIRFEFISRTGNNLFIDDINLFDPSQVVSSRNTDLVNSFNVYPNPTNGNTFISIEADYQSQVDISLLNVPGKVVKQVYNGYLNSGENRFEVDCSALPAGMYFIRVNSKEGLSQVKKLIVN